MILGPLEHPASNAAADSSTTLTIELAFFLDMFMAPRRRF
jgi:hypothetical protein